MAQIPEEQIPREILELIDPGVEIQCPSEEYTHVCQSLAKQTIEGYINLYKNQPEHVPEKVKNYADKVYAAQEDLRLTADDDTWVTIPLSSFAIASLFIHSWIYSNGPLDFGNGKKVNFTADVWGLGLGGGALWLGGQMAPADIVVGDANFFFATTPTATIITFWKNGVIVGTLAGIGINVQVGSFGGVGKFSWA